LIEEIQNQGPNWKNRMNVGVEIDQIRAKLKKLEVVCQLRVIIHKFRINDKNEKCGQFRG
jgi:hypothetical protein